MPEVPQLPARHGANPILVLGIVCMIVLGLIGAGSRLAVAQPAEGDALPGAYTVSITGEDVPLSLIGSAALQGAWIVRFDNDGSYAIERQDVGPVVRGTFEVESDEVTITDDSGLLSCANEQPIGDLAPTATYGWQKNGDLLQLEAIQDGCATRRVLLGTRALAPFVACRTEAVELSVDASTPAASDEGSRLDRGLEALQRVANDAASPEAATPTGRETNRVAGGTPPATPAGIGTADDPQDAISDLVGQLNACWATGDPARLLPLFSQSFIEGATGGGAATLDDVADQLRQLQTATVSWELAGDIEVDGDTATAVVASTVGGEETLLTFTFVREDGAWRLDNLGE